MVDTPTSKFTAAGTMTGAEQIGVSQLSTTVTITAATLSALASDNSYNDSGSGFIAAGFAVGNYVKVMGFTGNVVNNIFSALITALTAGKMTIGGSDGNVIVDDAAGETVTITKWTERRVASNGLPATAKTLITTIDYGAAASASNDVNITGYDEVWLEFDGVTVGAGEYGFRLSTNGGSSFFAGGTDYTMSGLNQTVGESNIDRSAARIGSGAGSGNSGFVYMRNLNRSGVKPRYNVGGTLLVGASGVGWGRCNQTGGPHNALRILNVSGNNSTAGKVEVWGR